ncbi:MAG: PHP domain-containing protein [Clostridia bacterium]|nr:PHP domain-containing protein [Clostridia bacterium]
MIDFDFHTHTKYSHGKGTILENAVSAKEKGLKGIAITDHGFNHPFFGMRRKKVDKMKEECILAEKQTGVKVLLGVESNIIGLGGETDLKPSDYDKMDIYLAGIHRAVFHHKFSDYFNLFGANLLTSTITKKPSSALIKNTTNAYINAIKNNPIDILTHLNFLCYADSLEVAKCLEDYGTYLEINTKKIHLTDEEWQNIIDKTKVNFVIDSDAHSPSRIGDTAIACELFSRVNFPLSRIHNIEGRMPTLRFSQFKERR